MDDLHGRRDTVRLGEHPADMSQIARAVWVFENNVRRQPSTPDEGAGEQLHTRTARSNKRGDGGESDVRRRPRRCAPVLAAVGRVGYDDKLTDIEAS